MDSSAGNDTSEFKQAAKEARIITRKTEYFGIPSRIVFNVLFFAVAVGAATKMLWFSLVFAALVMVPMYFIHRGDPHGLEVWARALFRKYGAFAAGRAEPVNLEIRTEKEKGK
jgi:uncharacterized membrane protein